MDKLMIYRFRLLPQDQLVEVDVNQQMEFCFDLAQTSYIVTLFRIHQAGIATLYTWYNLQCTLYHKHTTS